MSCKAKAKAVAEVEAIKAAAPTTATISLPNRKSGDYLPARRGLSGARTVWYECRCCLSSYSPGQMLSRQTSDSLRPDVCLFCQIETKRPPKMPPSLEGSWLRSVRVCTSCGVLHWPEDAEAKDGDLRCQRCLAIIRRGQLPSPVNDGLLARLRRKQHDDTCKRVGEVIGQILQLPVTTSTTSKTEDAIVITPNGDTLDGAKPKDAPVVEAKVIDMVTCDTCRVMFDPQKGGIHFAYVQKCENCYRCFTCKKCRASLSRKQVILHEKHTYCGNCLVQVFNTESTDSRHDEEVKAATPKGTHDVDPTLEIMD
jgi:hypothetical protein